MKLPSMLFLAMCGCSTLEKGPVPQDTELNEGRRDWAEIYRHEISIAVENEDLGAVKFFLEEIYKERAGE